jgi:hypothetical protein
MSAAEVIREARLRITNSDHHTIEMSARNASGWMVLPTDPAAVRWCACGSIALSCFRHNILWLEQRWIIERLDRTAMRMFGLDIAHVNDRLGLGSVLTAMDAAVLDEPVLESAA